MNYTDKKILIISHNPLSWVNNNGKTLASIFEGVPKNNIYQIYLNGDVPDYCQECHYLQINEKQILSSLVRRENLCCQEIQSTPDRVSSTRIKNRVFANHTKRLLREAVWKFAFWKPKLRDWLKDKRFDVIFFMAGDGLFAYDVYHFVMDHMSAKGCVFFTDDYIIGKTSYSPVALFRQVLLRRKMKKALKRTKELYVISEEMRQAYEKIFHMDSYIIRNFSVERKAESPEEQHGTSNGLTMVYAGGLHYKRWQVLSEIANTLKEINASNEIACQLKIYSSQNISDEIIEKIDIEGASEFCGGASASQIADIYAAADILLHVESFEKKAIASTKYSFSTKIPEYLSASKCVLAVGPAEVASVRYLTDFACAVSDYAELSPTLTKLINDGEYRNSIKSCCEGRYEKDFSRKKQKECLERILNT